MKTMNKKIIVSTLALAMGAALAGSISGSVAWYQYSTRANAEFQGVSAHCTENIEIRVVHGSTDDTDPSYDATKVTALEAWKSDLEYSDVANYLKELDVNGGANRGAETFADLRPVHTGALEAGDVVAASTLKKSPSKAHTNPTNWGAASTATDYVDIPLEIRVRDINNDGEKFLAKDIYITDVTIKAHAGSKDISDAVRVGVMAKTGSAPSDAVAADKYATFAKSAASVNHYGALDLDQSGADDVTGYSFDANRETYLYGAAHDYASYLEPTNGDYIRYGDKLFKYSTGSAPAAQSPTEKDDFAAIEAIVSPSAGDLAYAEDVKEFYEYKTTPEAGWYVLNYKTSEGAYAHADSKYYYCNGTSWAEDETLPAAVATATTPVAANGVKGVAVFGADGSKTYGEAIGSTLASASADSSKNLYVTLRIYLDGWQEISGDAVWNENLIGSTFDVGLRFETTLHNDATE